MKRWLLALAVLLGVPLGYASADYIVIVANLGEQREFRTGGIGAAGAVGAIGGMPQPGGLGAVGAIGGMPQPGGGGLGGRGIGAIGAFGGMPQPGGGGGRGIGAIGAIGGMPQPGGGVGAIGAVGAIGGNPTTPPKPDETTIDPDAVPLYVTAIVEIKNLSNQEMALFLKAGKLPVTHKYGTSVLLAYEEGERFHYRAKIIRGEDGKPLAPILARYEEKHKQLFTGTEKPATSGVLELAQWALEHGLLAKFTDLMDDLAKEDKTDKTVATYVAVKESLAAPAKDPGASSAQVKLQEEFHLKRTVRPDDHYVVYHHSPTDDPIEVKSRLDRLESSFKSFYYWFAMKGIALQVPKDRLVTMLTDKLDDFNKLHEVLASSPVVADGFFARRESASVFSTKRLDEGFETLEKLSAPLWAKGFNRDDLFKGTGKGAPAGTTASQLYEAQTLALLLKVMSFDAERAGVSHDGARQLIYGAGLLPSGVAAPEWVQFGVGSFFETPLGSPWTTTGAPSIEHLPNFRDYHKLHRFEKTAGDTLRKVVTDDYFHQAAKAKSPALERKARASAWALAYYLMRTNPDGMLRYYRELSKQPRDVELDDDTLLGCFARAFDLVDSKKNVDPRKVDELGIRWYAIMENTQLDLEKQVQEIRAFIGQATQGAPNTPTDPSGTPGNPGGPGGPGGPGNPGRGPGLPPNGGPPGPLGPPGRPPGQ